MTDAATYIAAVMLRYASRESLQRGLSIYQEIIAAFPHRKAFQITTAQDDEFTVSIVLGDERHEVTRFSNGLLFTVTLPASAPQESEPSMEGESE